MPTFYDNKNCHGVEIIISPTNGIFKKWKKELSRPIAVGDSVKIQLYFRKLESFEQKFWENRSVYIRLPMRQEECILKMNWYDNQEIITNIKTKSVDCEGDIVIRAVKEVAYIFEFDRNNAVSLFSAKAENKDWKRYTWRTAITSGVIVGMIIWILEILIGNC